MIRSYKDFPIGNNVVWAFAYREDDRAKNLFCKPVKGVLIGEYHEFYRGGGYNSYEFP